MTRAAADAPRPLAGLRVLVTRRAQQASALSAGLLALGATVVEIAAIEVAPPEDAGPLDAALDRLAAFDWIAFTSGNAVRTLAERLRGRGLTPAALPRVASVGPTTSRALHDALPACTVMLEPAADYRAEGLLQAFRELGVRGQRILLPLSDRARDLLVAGLAELGAKVEAVVAYRTVAPAGLAERLRDELQRGLDLAVLASPSAAENLQAAVGEPVRGLRVAAIGPVTAEAARGLGMDVRVVASPSTVDRLLEVLAAGAFRRDP